MKTIKLVLALLFATSLIHAEKLKVPENCVMPMYERVGDKLICADTSKIVIVMAQRDFHHSVQELYSKMNEVLKQENKVKDLGQTMKNVQQTAIDRCAQEGKSFDFVRVECGTALPQKEESKE